MSEVLDVLAAQGRDYLVLDFGHLFISEDLTDEAWILAGANAGQVLDITRKMARTLGLPLDRVRPLSQYSGGERALIGCLLILSTVKAGRLRGVRVLLRGILESLSDERRDRLLQILSSRDTGQVDFFIQVQNRIESVHVGNGSC
jgi:hypothetical protein